MSRCAKFTPADDLLNFVEEHKFRYPLGEKSSGSLQKPRKSLNTAGRPWSQGGSYWPGAPSPRKPRLPPLHVTPHNDDCLTRWLVHRQDWQRLLHPLDRQRQPHRHRHQQHRQRWHGLITDDDTSQTHKHKPTRWTCWTWWRMRKHRRWHPDRHTNAHTPSNSSTSNSLTLTDESPSILSDNAESIEAQTMTHIHSFSFSISIIHTLSQLHLLEVHPG